MSGPHAKSSQKIGTTLSQADDLHSVNYYDDPTGAPVPSNYKMVKGYSSVTTSTPGQHIHNYTYDPSDTTEDPEDPDKVLAPEDLASTVEDSDLWIDTTPETEE